MSSIGDTLAGPFHWLIIWRAEYKTSPLLCSISTRYTCRYKKEGGVKIVLPHRQNGMFS